MSPRPVEPSPSRFREALESARAGQFDAASRSIEETLAAEPERESLASAAANALADVARLAEFEGRLEVADRALERALELRPGYADLQFQWACVLLLRQRRPEARRALDEAIRLNPRYLAARLERAMLDAREGRVSDALEGLQSLEKDLPVSNPRAFQQGIKSLERAEWDEADALLRRALDLSNPGLQDRLDRMRAHLDGGEAARAMELLRETLPGHEAYPDLHYLLGVAELALGHFDDALVALGRALELNPDFHDARIQFARALDSVGAGPQAHQQLELVLAHDPQHRAANDLHRAWSERSPRDRDAIPATSEDRQVAPAVPRPGTGKKRGRENRA